jgi:hypothetical protein
MEPSLCSVDEAVQLSDGSMGHTMCVVEFVSKAAPVSSCTCNSGISLVCLDGGTVPKGVKSSDNVIGAVAHLLKKNQANRS